jgi:uncharacterized membrane protein YqiK
MATGTPWALPSVTMGGADEPSLLLVGVTIGAVLLVLLGALVLYARAFVKVEPGWALVVSKPTGMEVRFGGGLVIPVVHRGELMDIRTKPLVIDRRGKEGILCHDDIRADLAVTFYLRVNHTAEDVIKVAQALGCARAGDPAVLDELFTAKLAEAIKTVAKQLEELVLELERRKTDALARFREATGHELTAAELQARVEQGVRALVEKVLDERKGRA